MAGVVLGDVLDKHAQEIEGIGSALSAGRREEALAGLAGLATAVYTGIPGLGGLVAKGLASAFASPANVVLESQIAAWNKETDERRRAAHVTDAIEALLGQTLVQVVRSQHAVGETVIAALGGLRDDLAGFRAAVDQGMREPGLRVALQEIRDAGTGVRIRDRARAQVFIERQVVRGAGATGIVIG